MAKNIVKYANKVHELNLNSLDTAAKQNIFFALLMQFKNIEQLEIKLSYSEVFKLLGLEREATRNTKYKNAILSAMKELQKITMLYSVVNENEDYDKLITIFPTLHADHKNKIFYAKIHPDAKENYLNNQLKEFTRYELAEFIEVSGGYAKTIYRHLKQFKTTGLWRADYEDFKKLLNIPKSYQECDINKRILNPALKQLSKYFPKLMIKKIKEGRKIKYVDFYFIPERLQRIEEDSAKKQELSLEYIADTMKHEKMVKNVKDSIKAKKAQKKFESLIQAKTNQNTEDYNIDLLKSYRGRVLKIIRPEDGRSDDFRIIEILQRTPDGKFFLRCQNADSPDEIIFGGTDGFENTKHAINFIQKHLV